MQSEIIDPTKAKLEILKTLLAQQGDVVLTELDKFGLVTILDELIPAEGSGPDQNES